MESVDFSDQIEEVRTIETLGAMHEPLARVSCVTGKFIPGKTTKTTVVHCRMQAMSATAISEPIRTPNLIPAAKSAPGRPQ